ncbi:NADPH-adrenodoxin reductase [Coemansia sp. Benny D115]|nr:NADPH-adrenodoxin reductase [Coemansia sp. Benny D115]
MSIASLLATVRPSVTTSHYRVPGLVTVYGGSAPSTCRTAAAAYRCFATTSLCRSEQESSVAIVGGGAAGFYTAARLLAKTKNTRVDIFEQLPTPHGLVRYGVAPDHPEVKNCMGKFDEVAQDPRVRLFANVHVGGTGERKATVSLDALRSAYDGVVLAYGASRDRKLGVPGEDGNGQGRLGVVSARLFVAWYNGLPEAQDLAVDLSSYDRVVIVGHGNVALDCARILLTDPDVLAQTDITSRAVEVLRKSRVRHVDMVGRRGPLQVAFTTKELREMTKIPGLQIICDRDLVGSECTAGKALLESSRPLKRMMDLLLKHAVDIKEAAKPKQGGEEAKKTFTLRFLMSPKQVLFDQKPVGNGSLLDDSVPPQVVRFALNRLEGPAESAKAVDTGKEMDLPCSMALRSIGYASTPLVGAPFDKVRNIVPNVAGRVVDSEGELVSGLYAAGWVKRGPVGVIATTMQDAYRTADAIAVDINNGSIVQENKSKVDNVLEEAGIGSLDIVTSEDWKRLEEHEFGLGKQKGKPREKITDVEEMLRIIRNK